MSDERDGATSGGAAGATGAGCARSNSFLSRLQRQLRRSASNPSSVSRKGSTGQRVDCPPASAQPTTRLTSSSSTSCLPVSLLVQLRPPTASCSQQRSITPEPLSSSRLQQQQRGAAASNRKTEMEKLAELADLMAEQASRRAAAETASGEKSCRHHHRHHSHASSSRPQSAHQPQQLQQQRARATPPPLLADVCPKCHKVRGPVINLSPDPSPALLLDPGRRTGEETADVVWNLREDTRDFPEQSSYRCRKAVADTNSPDSFTEHRPVEQTAAAEVQSSSNASSSGPKQRPLLTTPGTSGQPSTISSAGPTGNCYNVSRQFPLRATERFAVRPPTATVSPSVRCQNNTVSGSTGNGNVSCPVCTRVDDNNNNNNDQNSTWPRRSHHVTNTSGGDDVMRKLFPVIAKPRLSVLPEHQGVAFTNKSEAGGFCCRHSNGAASRNNALLGNNRTLVTSAGGSFRDITGRTDCEHAHRRDTIGSSGHVTWSRQDSDEEHVTRTTLPEGVSAKLVITYPVMGSAVCIANPHRRIICQMPSSTTASNSSCSSNDAARCSVHTGNSNQSNLANSVTSFASPPPADIETSMTSCDTNQTASSASVSSTAAAAAAAAAATSKMHQRAVPPARTLSFNDSRTIRRQQNANVSGYDVITAGKPHLHSAHSSVYQSTDTANVTRECPISSTSIGTSTPASASISIYGNAPVRPVLAGRALMANYNQIDCGPTSSISSLCFKSPRSGADSGLLDCRGQRTSPGLTGCELQQNQSSSLLGSRPSSGKKSSVIGGDSDAAAVEWFAAMEQKLGALGGRKQTFDSPFNYGRSWYEGLNQATE